MFLITGASSSLLTGKACSPNSVQWLADTYSLARAVALPTLQDGGKIWYFLTVDYAFGHALEHDATTVLRTSGGTVLCDAKHPHGTTDFSAHLLQAGASGAKVLGFADSGQDMENAVKQAREFGLRMRLVPLLTLIMDVHSVALETMQGRALRRPVLVGHHEATHAWSKRFFESTGTTEAGAVVRRMKHDPSRTFSAAAAPSLRTGA